MHSATVATVAQDYGSRNNSTKDFPLWGPTCFIGEDIRVDLISAQVACFFPLAQHGCVVNDSALTW